MTCRRPTQTGAAATITEMTTKLLAALQLQKIPAVGFVNQKKVYKWGEVDERIKALQMWLDAGLISATILIVTCR